MRLVYATDLHGDPTLFHDLTRYVREQRPGALVLGGDALPSLGGAAARIHRAGGRTLRALLGDSPGYSPRAARAGRTGPGRALKQALGPAAIELSFRTQARFVETFLTPWADSLRVPVYVQLGNHCWRGSAGRAADRSPALTVVEESPARLPDGTFLLGTGCVPACVPSHQKDWERRDLDSDPPPGRPWHAFISRESRLACVCWPPLARALPSLESILGALPPPDDPWILLAHCPPADSPLDHDAHLDGSHQGSRAVRAFLKARQPRVSLHGHFHESHRFSGRWWARFGHTLAVQPGQPGRPLHACCFDLQDPLGSLRHSCLPTNPGPGPAPRGA